ncbi:CDGSH iron-sulfur domain-containing protein [Spongisporangium articulatum]|uniref:CDGSH iron-sulfur domain-containing protein n=1 Tax=Spongisporangium articulatum TaxID=3362603 RepID=A0ABW8AMG0_9ACTN
MTQEPTGEIRAYPGGPFLVRGDVELLDENGAPIPRRRRVVALCRCGRSGIAPFCDGTHKLEAAKRPPATDGPSPATSAATGRR